MDRRRRAVRGAMVVVLAAMAASLASCISAVERDYVTYDAGKDEFRMLMVLRGIQAQDSDDVEYLEALYANRDHWIAPAVPGGYVVGLLADSLIRMGDHDFSVLNMFASRPSNLDKTTTGVDLSQVEVVPGEFFVETGGGGADGKPALGYYQALRVPGKVVDGALAELSAAAQAQDLAKGIDAELLRRNAGGKVYTWAQLTEQTLKDITLEDPASQPAADAGGGAGGAGGATTQGGGPEEINPLMVMEEGSLKQLMAAVADKSLKLERAKTVVSLAVPMSAKDAAGFKGLLEACVARAREASAGAKETEENAEKLTTMRAVVAVGGQLKLEAVAGGLRASVDVVGLVDAVGNMPERRVDLNEKNGQEGEPVDAVAALKAAGVPVDEKLTAAEVVKEFDAGTLKGHAPEKSVTPGEGIVGKQ